MKQVLSVLALAAAAGLAAPALAQTQTYRAVASGPAESPPNASPGMSVVTIDLGGTNLMVDMPFSDLEGTSLAAHIHCCTASAFTGTAPIALPFADFPTGVQAGQYTHSIPLDQSTSFDPSFLKLNTSVSGAAAALVNGINANEAYVNIHTTEFPSGEIRGFLVAAPVPEPGEWALLAGGLASLLWMGGRRRWETSWQK